MLSSVARISPVLTARSFAFDAAAVSIVKSTAPVLKEHGETITKSFYSKMLHDHPELMNIFNPASQVTGDQPRSLAASLIGLASFADDLSKLQGVIERIAHKHVSLDVPAEGYAIVGKYLLQAIKDVLGPAATPAIIDAWAAAYGVVADVFIKTEQSMYDKNAERGWLQFKPFLVDQRIEESVDTISLVLRPKDGKSVPSFKPGQYLSLKAKCGDDATHWSIRQYSLSSAPNGSSYRIAVRRENQGVFSNWLHNTASVGKELLVHMPQGDFALRDGTHPVVLMSSGACISGMVSMLESMKDSDRQVMFLHTTKDAEHHALRTSVDKIAQAKPSLRLHTLYGERLQADKILPMLPAQADVYVSGSDSFMHDCEKILDQAQIPHSRRFTERFAPSTLNEFMTLIRPKM